MSWAKVPKDVLSLILTLLNLADLGNVAVVCSSWRSIARQFLTEGRFSARQLPWLTLSRHPEASTGALLRPPGTPAPDARRRRCCGVHDHWLAVTDDAGGLFLLHPLLGTRVELPPQSTLPLNIRSPAPPSYYYKSAYFAKKAVLSSPPTQAGCTVALIFMDGELAICSVGDSRWTAAASEYGSRRVRYQDIVFYKDELVAVDATEKAWTFGLRSGRLTRRPLARTWWEDPYHRPNQFAMGHLVVMDGRLLMLIRERLLVVDRSNVRMMKTTNFRTLMLEDRDELVRYWTPLNGIGRHVIFLGKSISVVVEAAQVGGPFLSDCIYFAEPEAARAVQMEDMGWFHMLHRTLFFENGRGGGGGDDDDRQKKVPIFHWMFNYGRLSS